MHDLREQAGHREIFGHAEVAGHIQRQNRIAHGMAALMKIQHWAGQVVILLREIRLPSVDVRQGLIAILADEPIFALVVEFKGFPGHQHVPDMGVPASLIVRVPAIAHGRVRTGRPVGRLRRFIFADLPQGLVEKLTVDAECHLAEGAGNKRLADQSPAGTPAQFQLIVAVP